MATQIAIGENSCKVIVSPSDTITSIFDEIAIFLYTKGWNRVYSTVSEYYRTGTNTFVCNGMDGKEKRFSIQVLPGYNGVELVAFIYVTNASQSAHINYQYSVNQYNWTSRFCFKLESVNTIYIFSSSRWALFTSENSKYGIGSYSIPEDERMEYTNNYNSAAYYYTNIGNNTIWYSNQGSMETLGSVLDYKGNSLIVPKEYNFFDVGSEIYYTHPSLDYHLNYSHQTISYRLEYAKLGVVNRGLTGCVEILTPNLKSLNWQVNTSKLSYDYANSYTARINYINGFINLSGVGTQAFLDNDVKNVRLCGLYGSDQDFSVLSRGKSALKSPWNNKNIVCDIHTADINSKNYLGSSIGLKITQADLSFSNSFLSVVWLKVDENWNLDSNGQSKKFFVVPGGCELNDSLPDRNWVWFNAEHTAVVPDANMDFHYMYMAHSYSYDGYFLNPTKVTKNNFSAPTYGYWQTGTVATKKYSHSSYLIPA